MNLRVFFEYEPLDTEGIRLEKFTIFLVAVSCCVAAVVWTAMYYYVFGFGLVTTLPFLFFAIVASSLIVCHFIRNHQPLVYIQIICIIYITTLIQWSIGGVFDSGFVLAWAFIGPIIALMFFSFRHSTIWLLLYLANIVVTVVFDDFLSLHGYPVTENTKVFFSVMNLNVSSLVVLVFASSFVTSAVSERENANRLLLNILPAKVAQFLKSRDGVIAEKNAPTPASCSLISSISHGIRGQNRRISWWLNLTRYFFGLTNSPTAPASRKSRPSGTPIWLSGACRGRNPVMPKPSPSWRWICSRRSRT